ncbi:MAG: sigma-70 family RNA polymerase sigma factor [Bacteroidota bacterium]
MSVPNRTVSTEDMQEEWLEIQAAQREPARFRPLYNRYYDPIFRFVFRRTADESLTADICSQVFLKAMQRLPKYEFKGVPFSAWLYRIASNEVAQHFRNSQKNRVVSIEEKDFSDMMDEVNEPQNELSREQLLQALDQLKEADLQLIELRFFEQRPFKEIADIVGITESNAKVKTYRILERLKKKLTQ